MKFLGRVILLPYRPRFTNYTFLPLNLLFIVPGPIFNF